MSCLMRLQVLNRNQKRISNSIYYILNKWFSSNHLIIQIELQYLFEGRVSKKMEFGQNVHQCVRYQLSNRDDLYANGPLSLPNKDKHLAQRQKSVKTVYGANKVSHIIICFVPLILLAPMISYYMAVKKGEQHKFPHPTITDTACHYPQDIQFRLIMGGSGSFVSFIYWILFRWMKFEKKRTQYPGTIYAYLYYIGQLSVWGFQIAMGTIDGNGYPDLHTNSAVFFFVMLFLIVMTQTIVIRDMYKWDSSVLSQKSYFIKLALGIYVACVWFFSLYGLITKPSGQNDDQNIYIVILEWNSVYVCLLWIMSYLPQWSDIHFTLSQYNN